MSWITGNLRPPSKEEEGDYEALERAEEAASDACKAFYASPPGEDTDAAADYSWELELERQKAAWEAKRD